MGSHCVTSQTAVSPALALAQERLLRLRLALAAKQQQGSALVSGDHGRFLPPHSPHQPSFFEQINELPSHLGWESVRVTAVLRQANTKEASAYCVARSVQGDEVTHYALRTTAPPKERAPFIKVYPSVAQGILREGQAAAGRVWLLLRYLDENGRGW
ncbi:MAG: hypothetical protein IAF02_23750, partial [Anaerolineae bacterium]|nr:hypothetical protein [Anaerolineae bacterium]